jgi:soluble lytic murein transglycosylase-like protein
MIPPAAVRSWHPMCLQAGQEWGVDPYVIEALIWQESAGAPHAIRYEPAYVNRYLYANGQPKPEWSRGLQGAALQAWFRRVASSYGLLQVLFPSAVWMGLSMSSEPEVLFQPSANLRWGLKLWCHFSKLAGGDLHATALKWNGGGNPSYPFELQRKRDALVSRVQGG